MLISFKHKFLFVHIAKTGGTSVRAALQPYRWGGWYTFPALVGSLIDQWTDHWLPFKFQRHAKAIAAMEMLPPTLWHQLFKFTFVRNPFDLQVSSFHHLHKEHPEAMVGLDTFPRFIQRKLDKDREPVKVLDVSRQLMSDYVVDMQGKLILDFIGRTENLEADFRAVCERIGIPPPPLPHERKAKDRKPYREYYDDGTRRLVEAHYARDLEIFGYEF